MDLDKINKQTLSELYDFPTLNTKKLFYIKHEQSLTLKNNPKFLNQTCFFGLEIEIEHITELPSPEYYWRVTEDHSLRNFGREFISIPLRTKQIPYALEYLKDTLTLYNPNYIFSNRCSLHTHLNVRDFTKERLCIFIILYCLFENHFFNIAGTKREYNIFCIPLWKTNQLPPYKKLMEDLNIYTYWNKYSALNCGSILGSPDNNKLGTIEFRHLYGTLDTDIIYHWINSILSLREASLKINLDILLSTIYNLDNEQKFYSLYKSIFNSYSLDYEKIIKNFRTILFNLKLNLFSDLSIFYNPIKQNTTITDINF